MTHNLPGLPSGALARWFAENLPDEELPADWHAELIAGGLSNLTYRVTVPGGNLILRRPPLGKILPRAHDVVREHRILSALKGTDVPVPETVAVCVDPDVIGAPFYVMREVHGRVLRSAEDTMVLTVDERELVAEALVQSLAGLHSVDPDAVGLGDYGRRGGYCARQLRTWGDQWARSRTRDLPDMDALLTLLAERVPADQKSAIVHGDFRLDNAILTFEGVPRVAAVLDWELSTLGDPLADLGLAMTYWHDAGDQERALVPVAVGATAWEGFPTARAFAERYARITGCSLEHIAFYTALGAMKLAVILEGVHARYLSGNTVTDGYDGAGAAVPVLVARGLRTLRD